MFDVLTTLLPMFAILLLGFFLGFNRDFASGNKFLNTFVFIISLPAFNYSMIVSSTMPDNFPWQVFLLAGALPIVYSLSVYWLARSTGGKYQDDAAPAALAGSFGNVGYFGLPITIALLGSQSAIPIAVVALFHNMIFLIGYPLARAQPSDTGGKSVSTSQKIGNAFLTLVRNPVAISTALGIAVVAWDIPLPGALSGSVELLGNTAVPLSLIAVGIAMHSALAGLRSGGISGWMVLGGVLSKNLGLPLATWGLALVFWQGLDPIWAGVLVLLAAMPSSTTVYILSDRFDPNGRLAAAILSGTTLASIVTIPLIAALVI